MINEALQQHLSSTIRADARTDYMLACGSLVGGLAIVIGSFYVVFVVAWILINLLPNEIENETRWAYIASGAFLVLVFFESWRSQRRLFEDYSDEHSAGGATMSAGLYLLGVGWGPRGIIPLSSGATKNSVKVIADLLYSGPRLLRNSARLLRRGRAKSGAQLDECSQVLDMALEANGRLSFDEITGQYPDIELATVLEQLSWLTGVVYLNNDPIGITLAESLRADLESELESLDFDE